MDPNQVIYPKDIQIIIRKSYKTALNLLDQVRAALGKKKKDLVTLKEFAEYEGLNVEEISKIIP